MTRNTGLLNESIGVSLVEGPFEALQGEWRFKALGEAGCRVDFSLTFVANKLLSRLINPIAHSVADRLVDAFSHQITQTADPADALTHITVTAVYATPDRQSQVTLSLSDGATLADAITAMYALPDCEKWCIDAGSSRCVRQNQTTSVGTYRGDRVECYRPLKRIQNRATAAGYRAKTCQPIERRRLFSFSRVLLRLSRLGTNYRFSRHSRRRYQQRRSQRPRLGVDNRR